MKTKNKKTNNIVNWKNILITLLKNKKTLKKTIKKWELFKHIVVMIMR